MKQIRTVIAVLVALVTLACSTTAANYTSLGLEIVPLKVTREKGWYWKAVTGTYNGQQLAKVAEKWVWTWSPETQADGSLVSYATVADYTKTYTALLWHMIYPDPNTDKTLLERSTYSVPNSQGCFTLYRKEIVKDSGSWVSIIDATVGTAQEQADKLQFIYDCAAIDGAGHPSTTHVFSMKKLEYEGGYYVGGAYSGVCNLYEYESCMDDIAVNVRETGDPACPNSPWALGSSVYLQSYFIPGGGLATGGLRMNKTATAGSTAYMYYRCYLAPPDPVYTDTPWTVWRGQALQCGIVAAIP
jgi:hypothetical protein